MLTRELTAEIDKEDKAIFKYSIADEILASQQTQQNDESSGNQKFLRQMRECLCSESEQPDQLLAILEYYHEDREKQRAQDQLSDRARRRKYAVTKNRLTVKHTAMVQKEFTQKLGNSRCTRVLEKMLSGLSWFASHAHKERRIICEKAGYLQLPPRQIIFRQGDIEDNLYFIVKGRVALETRRPEIGDLPMVIALVSDGDTFGHLT